MSRPDREHARYAHEAAITLHTPGRAIVGRTHNVSHGGLCTTIAEAIAVGTEIAIDLQLVFAEGQSEPLRLPARIVWCTAFDDRHQLGVQFLALDHETAAYLAMFLRQLDARGAAAPRPGPLPVDDRFG